LHSHMAEVSMEGLPEGDDLRRQMFHVWSGRLHWATEGPERRRTLAQLEVCEEITPPSRQKALEAGGAMRGVLERCRVAGPMETDPLGFADSLVCALADATIDAMIQDPAQAEARCLSGFNALWRMISQ